jgi:superfamily II DNA or RNA helicase
MIVYVSNNIVLHNTPIDIKNEIINELTINNPAYNKAIIIGRTPWGISKKIKLYRIEDDKLILPRGYGRRLIKMLKTNHTPFKIDTTGILELPVVQFNSLIKLRDYQQPIIPAILKNINGVVIAPCGSGKGHTLDTKIYTPNGVTTIDKLKKGDQIIGSDGKTINVTGIYDRGILPTYKIMFTDNTHIICDEDHIFSVQTSCVRNTTGNWQNRTVKELMSSKLYMGKDKSHNRHKWYIPLVKPVQFTEKECIIDPYILGLLLGDGGFTGSSLTFTNEEKDLIEKMKTKFTLNSSDGLNHNIINCPILRNELKQMNLLYKYSHEKFIPDIYKYNSVDVRLNILRGLIDSDGSVKNTSYDITSTSKQLIYDILEIIQSLGGTGKIAKRQTYYTYKGIKKPGKKSYRLYFKLTNFKPFSSEKHNKNYKERIKYKTPYRAIKSIEYAGMENIRCISVDAKDKLYVAENFIVTHNTVSGLQTIALIGQPALWITHTKDLLNQSLNNAIKFLQLKENEYGKITNGKIELGSHITFATIQTLASIDLDSIKDKFGTIVVDEAHHCFKDEKSVGQFYSVINSLPGKHRIGLTASEHRSDGLIETMFTTIGPKIYEVSQEVLRSSGKIIVPTVKFIPTYYYYDKGNKNLQFQKMLKDMTSDNDRNNFILSYIAKMNTKEYGIVLSDNLAHLLLMKNELNKIRPDLKTEFISGKTKDKTREESLLNMEQGKSNILFATYQLVKEGLDIPHLSKLFLTTPKRDQTIIQQSVGRIMRPATGKTNAEVFDFVDYKIPTCYYQGKARLVVYNELRCNLINEKLVE